ncbi:MAG: DNA methyltransferase, partial [Acidimicrobiales bacterium]
MNPEYKHVIQREQNFWSVKTGEQEASSYVFRLGDNKTNPPVHFTSRTFSPLSHRSIYSRIIYQLFLALIILDVPYGILRGDATETAHWDQSACNPQEVVRSIRQLCDFQNNQHDCVVILFCEHSMAGPYSDAILEMNSEADITWGAMNIKYSWKSPQKWMTNNFETYLIIRFGPINKITFLRSPDNPSYTSFNVKEEPTYKVNGQVVNYAQKPIAAMRRFIKMFSKPGDLIIDAYAGTHSATIAALIEGRSSIAFEADPQQWAYAQARVEE